MQSRVGESQTYTCRPYEPDDLDGFLRLYRSVWGHTRDRDWFRWRFVDNPYVESVPMVVAERDGTVVGAEPCLAFRLRVATDDVLAFQPADWVVHPDHRRRGVFSAMTERLLERYADGPLAWYFNCPSEAIVPGLTKFGWRIAGTLSTAYRVQNPAAVARSTNGHKKHPAATKHLGRIATPIARLVHRLRSHRSPAVPGFSVSRHDGVPADRLATFADRFAPDGIHVRHDASFYRWRFANPRWETATYVARTRGVDDVVAACVTATETRAGVRTTGLLDVLPRDGGARVDAYRALLGAVVADARDADVLKVASDAIPPAARREFGFWSDDAFPLARLAAPTRLAVRPAQATQNGTLSAGGLDPTDADRWRLSLADQDVA